MLAQGIVHRAWLSSQLLRHGAGAVFQDPWAFGDLVFGVGGGVVGPATLWDQSWVRKSGIGLCLLGLFTSPLWFIDEDHWDVSRVEFAANILFSARAVVGSLFYVLWWPTLDTQAVTAGREANDVDDDSPD
jgi:hypothetical protein